MTVRGDERAVSAIIGAVLLLGIFVTALALYQVNVVPQENADVEYTHNEQVQGELQQVRNAIGNTDQSSATRSTSVQLGTQYPDRWITINPPPARGSIATSEVGTVQFDNADIKDRSEYDGPVENLINDSDTKTISYEPNYNEYQNAPTTHIEHSLVYNDFNDPWLPVADQQLIAGDELTLVLVRGDISESASRTTTIDTRTLSGPTVPVEIEDTGSPIELTLPTQNPGAWDALDLAANEDRVTDVSGDGSGNVVLTLERGTYTLQMACVGVGSGGSTCDGFDITHNQDIDALPGPNATNVSINESTVTRGDSIEITGMFSNRGNQAEKRGGVPIVDTRFDLESESGSINRENEEFDSSTYTDSFSLNVTAENTTDTGPLDSGNYTVRIRAQDTRGIWTNTTEEETATFTVLDGPTFDSLEAQVTSERGGTEAEEVTFSYELSENVTDVTLTIEDSNGNVATADGGDTPTSGGTVHTVTVSFGSGGPPTDNYPVDVTANIDSGECLSSQLNDGSDTATTTNGDWGSC